MITSAGGETAPRSKKGGNYASCADANRAGPKMKKKITRLIQLIQMDGEDLKQQ
jgi:hypothetical protein